MNSIDSSRGSSSLRALNGRGVGKVGKSGQYIAAIHQRAALDSTAWWNCCAS